MRQFLKIGAWIVAGVALQIVAAHLLIASYGKGLWWLGSIPQAASVFVYYWLYREVPGPKRLIHNVLGVLDKTLSLPEGGTRLLLFIHRKDRLVPKYVYPRAGLPSYHLSVRKSDPHSVPEGIEGKAFRSCNPESEEGIPTIGDGDKYFEFWKKYSISQEKAVLFDSKAVARYCWPVFPETNQHPMAILTIESRSALTSKDKAAARYFQELIRDAFEVEKASQFKRDFADVLRALLSWIPGVAAR